MRERQSIYSNIDGILFLSWFVLALAGCFTIFSAVSHGEWIGFLDFGQKHMRQFIFLIISLVMMIAVFSLDYNFIVRSTPVFYIFCILLLVATLFIGTEINGSKSWIRFGGGFQLQPSEFAKTATALMLAYWFMFQDNVFGDVKKSLVAFAILGMPMVLILLQGDMGSMLTFAMLVFVFYREGLTPVPIYLGLAAIFITLSSLAFGSVWVTVFLTIVAAIIYWLLKRNRGIWKPIAFFLLMAAIFSFSVNTMFKVALKDYQQDRVLVILGLKEDLHGAGYNLWQSKMAVSSGRFLGKGYLQGIQTQNEFVPEVSTDYIFSNIGEEWGFLGSLFIVGMFSLLIFRILKLAEQQKSDFSRVFMYCAACFFTVHVFINIGMVIGIFPTAGIPLPFFSYGGSSLLSFSLIIALVLRLNAENAYRLS